MKIMRKPLCLALATALLGAGLARAEEPAAAANAPADADAAQLGNITVTAQSRTQEVQDVPIPIQIVTEKQIQSLAATDLSKMDGYIPGLVVSGEQPTQPNYSLRGISVSDFGIGTDSPIGVYEDGVYAGKTGGALLLFNDVQRVEVLKGPQGTLFGRNSAGGAISVATNEPGDALEQDVRVRIGDYGLRYLDGVLNTPIGNDAAFRLTIVDNNSTGWLRDSATGQRYDKTNDFGLRAQFRWSNGETKVRVIWEHEQLDDPARPAIGIVTPTAQTGTPPFPTDPATWLDPFYAPVLNDVIDGRRRATSTASPRSSITRCRSASSPRSRRIDTFRR
jgi:iron complex outermembrane receptor protein